MVSTLLTCFRARKRAAPLKPRVAGVAPVGMMTFPRAKARGPIEATGRVITRNTLDQFPRAKARGPIEAVKSFFTSLSIGTFPRAKARGPIEATAACQVMG